jgi:Rrf2 family protein
MRGKYGLKAILHLSRLRHDELALSAEIALANAISKKFLDAILQDLRMAGIIHARKGRGGGYRLARPAERITLGEVLRVLDGPVAPIQCASRTAYRPCRDCPDEARCAVRLTMIDLRDAIATVVDSRTIADMAASADEISEQRAAS